MPRGEFLRRYRPILDRLLCKCEETDTGCWEFTGARTVNGYGRIGLPGADTGWALAHRVAYEEFIADIPPGLDLDHLCRNRACCNPWHLEPVTRSVNLRRSPIMGRKDYVTHCPEGHPYDEENTYRNPQGRRACRKCWSAEFRRLRAERAAAKGDPS